MHDHLSGNSDTNYSSVDILPDHLLLQWHLTERCNLHCSHCYQSSEDGKELDWSGWSLVLDQFQQLVTEVSKKKDRKPRAHVTVTGGEPFLKSDFLRLLNKLHTECEGWSFGILSNGTMIDMEMAHHLAVLNPRFVQVSIDGTESTHDRIRGSGTYARAVKGMEALVKFRIPTLLAFTAQTDNYHEFPAVAKLGCGIGVQRVWADRLVPLGHADMKKVLDPDQTRELIELMRQVKQRVDFKHRHTEIAAHRALQFPVDGSSPYRCSAGYSLITILPNGDVCPCRRMPAYVGNVLSSPLFDLYMNNPLMRRLRDRKKTIEGCQDCFYEKTCAGGLRCLSAAVHGDPFVTDPGCWLAHNRQGKGSYPQEVFHGKYQGLASRCTKTFGGFC